MTIQYEKIQGASQQPFYPSVAAPENGVMPVYPVLYTGHVQPATQVIPQQPQVIVVPSEERMHLTAGDNDANTSSLSVNTPKKGLTRKSCCCCLSICCLMVVVLGFATILLPLLFVSRNSGTHDCDSNPAMTRTSSYVIPITSNVQKLELRGPASFHFTQGYYSSLRVEFVKRSESSNMDPSSIFSLHHSINDGTLQITVTGLSSPVCASATVNVYLPGVYGNWSVTDIAVDALAVDHYNAPVSKVDWSLFSSGSVKVLNSMTVKAEEINISQLQARSVNLSTKRSYNYFHDVSCSSCRVQRMNIVAYSARVYNLESFPSANTTSTPTVNVNADNIAIESCSPAVMNLTANSRISMRYYDQTPFYGTLAFKRTIPTKGPSSRFVDFDISGQVSYEVEQNTNDDFNARVYKVGFQPTSSTVTAFLTGTYGSANLYMSYK